MKAITAKPETIREVFSKKYIIPNFQRPYSWETEQCEKLWDDIIDFYNLLEGKQEKYFLGNIVINPAQNPYQGSFEVVDGQQRLTTLLLLIKALHSRAFTVKALEECLRVKNPLTSELTNELRVTSLVIDEDMKGLKAIILGEGETITDIYLNNYTLLNNKVGEWLQSIDRNSNDLNSLILALLDHVVLLPIHCESEDDSLTIFETINNRGMSLSDADIFKAKLYQNTPKNNQADFIESWNNLEGHDWLFRILMHILRAEKGESSKEIAMRAFFTAKSNPLSDCGKILKSLKVINLINSQWYGSNKINSLWQILNTYPNYYWNFPLFIFLHKYGELDVESNEFSLADEYLAQFTALIEATVKYFFLKGVVHNSVNTVRDTVFRVCVSIEKEKDYLSDYSANITQAERERFSELIQKNQLRRYLRGIVLLAAYLNPNQDKEKFSDFISEKYDIEHILPKKWNHYDGWTDELWSEQINLLGNLIPLSKALNIAARNEFFDRKKKQYEKSTIQDALDLIDKPEWTPEMLLLKQDEKIERLHAYFAK